MDESRSAYIILMGLTVGCYVGYCKWLLPANANTLQHMIVVLAVSSWMSVAAMFSSELSRGIRLVYSENLCAGSLFLAYLLIRRFLGWNKSSVPVSPFSIKQCLAITLLIAIHCAGVRAMNGLSQSGTLADFVVIGYAVAAMSIQLLMFRHRAWWIRYPVCLTVGTLIVLSGIVCLAKIHGPPTITEAQGLPLIDE